MSRCTPITCAMAVLAALTTAPLWAQEEAQQEEAKPDSQLLAGLRVHSWSISPNPIHLMFDDTVTVTINLADSTGEPVTDARWGMAPREPRLIISGRPISMAMPVQVMIWGTQPGTMTLYLTLQVPDDSGAPTAKTLDSLTITVEDWPVARVAVEDPEFTPYVGTSFKLHAKAITTHDTEHSTARVTWRSESPEVATVTPQGIVSVAKRGRARLVASVDTIAATYELRAVENPIRQLDISPKAVETRTGDVVHFDVRALDRRGRPVEDIALSYATYGLDSAGAVIFEDGAFVAENPGAYKVVVSAGNLAAEAIAEAGARPKPTQVEEVGRGAVAEVTTSDLWVFTGQDGRDYAYTGTHAEGGGERMYAWDVTDPANIQLVDSVVVDGRVINDVKVSADASWAIITREGASDRKNGIVVLDLTDPAHPTIMAELTDSLTAGIHNVWINGEVVYAVNDGTAALHILDLSDPKNPQHVGRWEVRPEAQDKFLHDVWADGQYAYLSYWNDGLVILDIGAGTHGGTPTEPKFVSSISYDIGNTHTAYREGNYVFVGDEIFDCEECINGPRGYIHVMDVSDIDHPKEVARYEVPEAGAHNVWVENGILYIAYYQGGVRIVDVTGELRGDLYAQGRQIGWFHTSAPEDEAIRPNLPMAWGPQPFKGNIFVSDMNSGLWVLKHHRPERLSP